MKKDWKTYCLMSAIFYIEEISKPNEHIQIKKYKNKKYRCLGFHSIRLKMRDEETVKTLFETTKKWEILKKVHFIGKTFDKIRKENFSNQDMFLLAPLWLNYIIAKCGRIPNAYSFETAIKRISHFKQYKSIAINKDKNLFNLLFKDKKLAAGAFIVSMDLEFRGIQNGRLSLCMSEKYKDFLEFMLKVAKKWGWTNNKELSKVSIENSKRLGINASPQYEFRITIKGLKEIYWLAGPLANSYKDKCIQFNILRSENYVNLGGRLRKNRTKEKILKAIRKSQNLTSTKLQFIAHVGTDVVLDHLRKLEKEGKIKKERNGKRYIWNLK